MIMRLGALGKGKLWEWLLKISTRMNTDSHGLVFGIGC